MGNQASESSGAYQESLERGEDRRNPLLPIQDVVDRTVLLRRRELETANRLRGLQLRTSAPQQDRTEGVALWGS